MSGDGTGPADDGTSGERLAETLRGLLLDGSGDEVGPHVRAYLEAAIERAGRDGEVTFEAGALHEALVADSPDVARLDDYRDDG